MASVGTGGGEVTQVSSLPPPPQAFVCNYSDDNVKKGKAPKPPPPPASHETYIVFGVTYHADDAIIRPLESQVLNYLKFKTHFLRFAGS